MTCPKGQWSKTGGLTYCYNCPRGEYTYEFGSTECTASTCNPGRFQSDTQVNDLREDENGKMMPYSVDGEIAMTSCVKCPLDTYQPLSSMFYCFACPSGKHSQEKRGAQSCSSTPHCHTVSGGNVYCTADQLAIRRDQPVNPEICQNLNCTLHAWQDNGNNWHHRVKVTHIPGPLDAPAKQEPAELAAMNAGASNYPDANHLFFTGHHICKSNYDPVTNPDVNDCSCWCW
jgi:hypothetical protein